MTDTIVFDPTDKKLDISTEENQVFLRLGDDLVAHCTVEGCHAWDDSKILAYFYLESLYYRGCATSHKYNESIFTLILNTLRATGRDDFITADWTGVRYEVAEQASSGATVYVTATTTDGFDLTLNYMSPGLARQETIIRHQDEIPSIDELYAGLSGKREKEWVNNGTILFNGLVFNYDSAATAMFTMNHRLQIFEEGGELLLSDEDVQGSGLLDILISLYRKLQLRMVYGEIEALSNEQRLLLSTNLGELLSSAFGMSEYLEMVDGVSVAIRGSINNEIQCAITHTYLADTDRVRADFRFFTMSQSWMVEHSVTFGPDEEEVFVTDAYNRNTAQIRAGLGLDVVDQPINTLNDLPFDNRDFGGVPQNTDGMMFTPVTNEQMLEEYPDEAEAGEPLNVTAVVAVGPAGGIGIGSDLLFRIKEDLQFFKQVTSGHVVIMGRKTFESIGKPLPNRQNIVITTDPEYVLNLYTPENDKQYDNLHCVTSIEEAVRLGGRLANTVYNNNELMVIGGATIYDQFMPFTQRILMTSVNASDSHADVFFPLSGADIELWWQARTLNETQEGTLDDTGVTVTYDRYELTRKQ